MSFISSFDIISVVLFDKAKSKGRLCGAEEEEWRRPDPKIFLCIPASAADAAAVNPGGIKTLLANGLITLLLEVILFLVMDQEVYQEILLIAPS